MKAFTWITCLATIALLLAAGCGGNGGGFTAAIAGSGSSGTMHVPERVAGGSRNVLMEGFAWDPSIGTKRAPRPGRPGTTRAQLQPPA